MSIISQFYNDHSLAFIIIMDVIFVLVLFCIAIAKEFKFEPWYYDSILYRFNVHNLDWLKTGEPEYSPFKFYYKGSLVETYTYDEYLNKPEGLPFYTCSPEVKILYINNIPVYCIYKLNRKRVIYWNTEYDLKEAIAIIKCGNKAYKKSLMKNSLLLTQNRLLIIQLTLIINNRMCRI